MNDILNLDIFNLSPQYIKLILFVWNIIKCTFLLVISIKVLRWFLNKFFRSLMYKIEVQERRQQLLTLKTIITHAIEAVIFVIYLINILFIFGIDVRPFIATAGVLGVAIGFGAKRFVEDIITGIIILIEGQIRVGDYVDIHGMKGTVEKITLPMITVRSDRDGSVYFIRCGYIDSVKNHTMHYAYACFEFDVAYRENVDHVQNTIKKCYDILVHDDKVNKLLDGDIVIFGLDEFKESSLSIKCRIKTQPKAQWTVKRAFNKIIKEQFEVENIEIPYNQLVINKPKEDK